MNSKNILRAIAAMSGLGVMGASAKEVDNPAYVRRFMYPRSSSLQKPQKKRNFGKSKRFSSAKKSPYRSKLVMFNSGIFPDRFRGI
jgi:hypothetical protein